MSETENAVAWMREQFGEGWMFSFTAAHVDRGEAWVALAHRPGIEVECVGPDPMSAARACVEAYQEACPKVLVVDDAERADADRLAEALRGVTTARFNGDSVSVAALDALAAHDARRGKEGA